MNRKESPRIMSAKYLLVFPALMAVLLTMQISDLQAQEKSNKDNHIHNIIAKSSSDKPLIVIDGKVIPNEEAKDIDPTKIESITVLKENSATAIYGEIGKTELFLSRLKSRNKNIFYFNYEI